MSQIEVLFQMIDDDGELNEMGLTKRESSRPPKKRKMKKVGFLTASSIFIGGVFQGLFAVVGRYDVPLLTNASSCYMSEFLNIFFVLDVLTVNFL